MRLVRPANKGLSLICGWLIVEPCEVLITAHVIWCFIIIYINGTKLNFGAIEMKSQANAPIWHDGPCLPRLPPGRDFLRAVRGFFSVRKLLRTIFNYVILCQVLGLRCWVMLTVTITPNIYTRYKCEEPVSVKRLVQCTVHTHCLCG